MYQQADRNAKASCTLLLFVCFDTGSLCYVALAIPELAIADQAGFELRDLLSSASQVPGWTACATMPGFSTCVFNHRILVVFLEIYF